MTASLAAWGAEQAGTKGNDDLLDPSKIGAGRKSMQSEGLIDPSALRPSTGVQPDSLQSKAVRFSLDLPSDARGRADLVVQSLDGLSQSCATRQLRIEKLDAEARELEQRLAALRQEMVAKMEEYRNGLFCSGCNQTKSEILAKGETFPHPGQHEIRPTPQQIADKERELQAPIDEAEHKLTQNRQQRTKDLAERDEVLLQLIAGYSLWVTSVSFEHSIILAADRASEERYKIERRKTEDQLSKLLLEWKLVPGDVAKDETEKYRRERDAWTAIQQRLDDQRSADLRNTKSEYTRAGSAARNDCERLKGYFDRPGLRRILDLEVSVRIFNPEMNFDALGGFYRMGDFSPSRNGETLSEVKSFVDRFRASLPTEFLVINNVIVRGPSAIPPGLSPATAPAAKNPVKDLLDALPAGDDRKPKPPGG